MKSKLLKIGSIVLASVLILSLAACGGGGKDAVIRVGSKDFTESLVVAEIYALALEDAGFTVDRTGMNLASGIVHDAITNDEIDIYPEYTGTGLLSVLGMDLMTDPKAVYELVKREYNDRYDITWLDFTTAHNGQGVAIRTQVSRDLGITTISDLQRHAHELRFVTTPEFLDREDGLPGMELVYGPFDFASVDTMGGPARYEALRTDEADVSVVFTTDGPLFDTETYTVLIEDIVMWPPYNLIPIVRNNVLEANPGIADALNRLAPHFTTAALLQLNSQVVIFERDIEEVAQEFFSSIR